MKTMNMPGFTADASIYKTRGRYQSVATQRYSSGEQRVVSQIRAGGGFRGFGGQKLGFWCELGCAGPASLCIAAGVATGNPLAVAACIAAEIACLARC